MHTFVIPVYKESPYLEQCIQSLINQTVGSKIIITTSTPSAFSTALAKSYGLDYFISHKKGIANDWNFALSKAATPFVTIAHQDDVYHPKYTENIIKTVSKTKDTLIIFTDYQDLINNKPRAVNINSLVKKVLLFPFIFTKVIRSNHLKKLLLSFGDPICCPSVTFNKKALQDFTFSTELTCVLDWFAWLQLASKSGSFCFINKKLLQHRIHPDSETTVQISQGIRKQEELQMFKLIWGNKTAGFIAKIYTLGHADNKL